jgi:predicted nuclease of restriction endonuclease-like (RecB) superfamily
MTELISNSRVYRDLLASLKSQIRTARVRAALAVNRELVLLYWHIGTEILTRQRQEGWGAGVIERLATDLRAEFPDMQGLSPRNLKYMRAFADAWRDGSIVQQAAAQLPWFHNCVLLEKVKDPAERLWYVRQTIQNGWSRSVLVMQIESGVFRRQGTAITNFKSTLPASESDLAQQLLKDPYTFDFLTLTQDARERELESGLLVHLRDFLIELGAGFAFVGSQVPLEVGGEDFRLDLLFYHLKLRCFVVIDLKMGPFKPEYAGKMNFYLAVADDLLRHPGDKPSIGLVLCKAKNRIVAEYALRNVATPMGVSEFKLQGTLPTVEEIEAALTRAEEPARIDPFACTPPIREAS